MTIVESKRTTGTRHAERGYKQYVEDGGRLSKTTYRDALDFSHTFRHPFASFSQAESMTRHIPRSRTGQEFPTQNRTAIQQIYGTLREQMHGECTGWSDQQIFAETLLIHHHFSAYKSFKKIFTNIFGHG